MKTLGKTAQAVYDYIVSYIEERSYPPTVREICAAVSLKSTSTVHMHLKTLESKGYIRMDPSKQRTISVVRPPERESGIMQVPLIDAVAAGNPILSFDDIQEYVPVPLSMLHGAEEGEVFMLTVDGNSMIEVGIHDGDQIIVHRGMAVENSNIAVARIGKLDGDRATVKRIFYEVNNNVRLQPENTSMEPILVNGKDLRIIGRVIGLMRRY